MKFPPSTSVTSSDTITFNLNKFDAANLYMLNNACVQIRCKITKSDGKTLPTDLTKKVIPCNNILHSAFKAVRVYLNDQPITKQPDHYQYKSYVATLLTYDSETKNAQLACQGFYSDISNHMSNSEADYLINTGASQRTVLFREGGDIANKYKPNGVKFFGRLHIDLISSPCGIIPGTKIMIQLVKNDSSFMLMTQTGDNEKYQFIIEECDLFIPIGQVSAPVYAELSSVLAKKSVSMHYRRTEIRLLSITKDKLEFVSDQLFSGILI